MEKLYDRIDWHNNTTPAINETNLNKMSKAVDDIDDRVILIAGDILVTVPELQEMLEDCTELEQRLEAMTENPPYIGDNGHWYIWDTDTGAYVDSGIDASITVEIADITMLEPNATPYVTNTGTDTDPIFHLFIPRGQSGKGISSIAKTGTSGYVDTYTITYTDNTSTTYTVTNGRNTDQMPGFPYPEEQYEGTIYQYIGETDSRYTHGFYYECMNVNGTYDWVNIPVGNDPVEVSNTDPYTYRQGKGYLADIEIVGASVGWNQLVANSGTVSVTVPSGHKYLSKISGSWSISQSSGTAISSLVGGTDMIIDLTQAFNLTVANAIYAMEQANEGAGVAFFRKYFPKDYYAYDAGSIQSVCVGSRKVVGKNICENLGYSQTINGVTFTVNPDGSVTADGKATANAEFVVRSISGDPITTQIGNYILSISDTAGSSSTFRIVTYARRASDSTLIFDYLSDAKELNIPLTDVPSGWRFSIRIMKNYNPNGKTFYPMVRSAVIENGDWVPYSPNTFEYPFDSTKELRGMFDLVGGELKANGDIYTADGNIQRKYGIVDLGTLTWTYRSEQTSFSATLSGYKFSNTVQAVCDRYNYDGTITGIGYMSSKPVGTCCLYYSSGQPERVIYIKDTSTTDAATFKTNVTGKYLVYELATPTTESAQPYQNPQRAYIDGTEEFTDGLTRDVMIPVGNNSVYQQDKILPSIEDYVDAVAEDKAVPSGGTTGQVLAKASGTDYDTEWVNASGGSGGHTILNGSGTAMTQRGKLQFNGATVTDDSANDKTIVTTTPQSMIGDAWVTSHAYAVGDYRIDGNVLYKCKQDHTSSSSNRPPYASYWDAVSVASQINDARQKAFIEKFKANAPYGSLMKHSDVTIVSGGWYISNDVIYINARVKATATKAAGAALVVLAATREQIGGKTPDRLYPIICASTRGINWAAAYSNAGNDFYIALYPPSNIAITQNDIFDIMGFANLT